MLRYQYFLARVWNHIGGVSRPVRCIKNSNNNRHRTIPQFLYSNWICLVDLLGLPDLGQVSIARSNHKETDKELE